MENVLFERLLKFEATKPDIAIFLNGINERGDIEFIKVKWSNYSLPHLIQDPK